METSHSHHLETHSDSYLVKIKPEIKLLSFFTIILSIAFLSLENNVSVVLQAVIVAGLLIVSKLQLKTYLKRLSIDIPFVSKGNGEILTSFFNFSIYKTGVDEMISILIKITLCVTLAIVLTATTSNIEIIYGLQKLKVSPLLISIFSFAIRYIDVFIDEVKRVKISMRSRGYSEKGIKTLKPLAFASGALLIRGYERGERVYNSMISRGFKGTLELEAREFNSSNLILLISIFSIAICIVDRFVL